MKFERITWGSVIVLLLTGLTASGQQGANHWVGIWATAGAWRPPAIAVASGSPPLVPAAATPVAPVVSAASTTTPPAGPGTPTPVQISGQTLRQVVHTTFGGDR